MERKQKVVNRLAFLEAKVPAYTTWIGIIGILIVWEVLGRSGIISALYLPTPTILLATMIEMGQDGELVSNLQASLTRIAWGFSIGAVLGILCGLVLGIFKIAEAIGNPIVHALYPVPKIALLPLIILWLGIGEISKVTIIALGVFFPVLINTYAGVKNVETLFIKVGVSFQISKINMIKKIILPAALPSVFAGLKLGAGSSLLLLVAAEMIAAKEGLGALILHYGDLMITSKLMVGVIVLSFLGILFNFILSFVEKRCIRW